MFSIAERLYSVKVILLNEVLVFTTIATKRLRYLSTEEWQTHTSVCPSYLEAIVIVALNIGLRKEEILSLQWEKHVDLRHGFILLDVTKNGERR